MITLSSVIDTFQAPLLAQYRDVLLPSHLRALSAMKHCRTSASPVMLAQCTDCHAQRLVPHSCGHRSCPHCQHHEGQQWLERQLRKQLPAEYFLLTFTLPEELRELAWRHQRTVYDLMIRCSWDTVRTFAANDAQLHGTPGAITVVHTHSRRLRYHPHVHLVMPAAAVDATHQRWNTPSKPHYLFSHKALATVFRAKLLDAIGQHGLELPPCYPKNWIVDVRSVGSGHGALIYLGRYLYKGVIQERDIVACDGEHVTFRYTDSQSGRTQFATVPGARFLWMVLQHVLPRGFRRTRNFGFLHPNSKRLIALIQYLLKLDPKQALAWLKLRPPLTCSVCGAVMRIVKTRLAPDYILAST